MADTGVVGAALAAPQIQEKTVFEQENDEWDDDRLLWADGEWVTWSDVGPYLEEQELRAKYPNADLSLVPFFHEMLELAERYYMQTDKHLQIYGDIGELFCAITSGMDMHKNCAQGSDGRLGKDFIEVKTITPFKNRDVVEVKASGNFNKLFVVKIDENFIVSGRMVDRKNLKGGKGKVFRVKWSDLPID